MNIKRDLLTWSTVLYVVVVLASLPMTARDGRALPPGFDPALATIIAQVGTILLPTLIFLALVREPAQEMLSLRRLDFGSAVKSFLAGLMCWPMLAFLATLGMILVGLLQPAAPDSSTSMMSQGGSPWLVFLGVVLVAPFCEEMLFRGVLLGVYQKRFAVHAIWLVAILFAFLHPSLDQVLGALFLGMVAGWVVYRTRSLWAGVMVHAGNNLVGGALVLLTSLAAPGALESAAQTGDAGAMVWIGALVWAVIGLVMLVPVFLLLRSIARRHAAPEAAASTGLSWKALWAPAAAVIGVVGYTVYDLLQGV
jgi:uncharacterized protein